MWPLDSARDTPTKAFTFLDDWLMMEIAILPTSHPVKISLRSQETNMHYNARYAVVCSKSIFRPQTSAAIPLLSICYPPPHRHHQPESRFHVTSFFRSR